MPWSRGSPGLIRFHTHHPYAPLATHVQIGTNGAVPSSRATDRNVEAFYFQLKNIGKHWDAYADLLHGRCGWSPGCRNMSLFRVQRRLRFIVNRYKDDAPYWAFVVWLRKMALLFSVAIPQVRSLSCMTQMMRNSDNPTHICFAQLSGNADTPFTLCAVSFVAIVVLGFALASHKRVRPYHFDFQNALEVHLLLCSMLVIVLGLIYTFVAIRSVVVEALLMTVLLGSVLASIAQLLRESRTVGRCRQLACFRKRGPANRRGRARTDAAPQPYKDGRPTVQMQMLPAANAAGAPFERLQSSSRSTSKVESARGSESPASPRISGVVAQTNARCSAAI